MSIKHLREIQTGALNTGGV